MARYEVLWVDDHWNKTVYPNENKFLSMVSSQLEQEISKIDRQLNIVLCERPSDAVLELQEPSRDFRLAVIDYDFGGDKYNVENIMFHIRQRNIPYIIFSNFIESVENDPLFPPNDPLMLDLIEKGTNTSNVFINRLKNFFLAPPFRIVHLTDLHYNSEAKEEDADEQTDLFLSLIKILEKEHSTNPFDVIAITGDFSYRNPDKDLIFIRDTVKEIVRLTLTEENIDRLLLVPGNHDIYWKNFYKKKLSENPWGPYLEFYHAVYPGRIDILNELGAWNSDKNLFSYSSKGEDLLWHRKLSNPSLNIIGLVTPTTNTENLGNGLFTKKHVEFINSKWCSEPTLGEVRLVLMHHNLFATLSLSRYDKKTILSNPGDAMYTLMSSGCNVALTGHTHSSNVLKSLGGRLGLRGFEDTGNVSIISAGTTGGLHKAGDRPRSFNILEFSDRCQQDGNRQLRIRPFLYDGDKHKWNELDYYLFGEI